MKKISLIAVITLLILSSCGKKGTATEAVAVVEESPTTAPTSEPTTIPTETPQVSVEFQTITIDAICNESNGITNYTPLLSGDIVSKKEDNTTIQIFHSQDNEKLACVEYGSATILRFL